MGDLKSREEFERNFFLLKESKISFSNQTKTSMESLMKVRYLPNKRIDFLTVNESARLLANMSVMFDHDFLQKEIEQTDKTE